MKWGGRVYVTLRPRFGPKERAPHWPARCMTWRQRGHMVWKAGMTRSPAQGPVRATTSSPSSSTVRKAPSSASAIAATTCPACSSVRWAPVAEAAVRAGIAGRAAHHIGRSRAGYRLGDNDSRILAVARNLQAEGFDVTVVSKDLPLRIKASSVGLLAEEYRAELAITDASGWTGMSELTLPGEQVDVLFEEGRVHVPEAAELPVHTGLTIQSERGKALGRVTPDGNVRLVRGDREAFGIKGRSAEQRIALDLLLDPDIGIVSMGGRAGTGKSALALCAGLEAVLERRQHQKVMVFRPLYAVGGQELGYLPGSEAEKMSPWAQAVFDTLSAVTSREVIEEVTARGMLEVLPLTHIRGRSLHDAFVIVDEAQSLERNVLLTVLSRIGANSRVVLTHDVAQRDNLRVGRYDGVVAVVEKLKGHPLFAHVTLTRSERSQIAALVTEMLEDGHI
ncbi:hypothetical protein STENM327S_01871 [Streptomyces tendae]